MGSPTRPVNRWPALLTLCAGFLMIILDGNIVAVALPDIQDDLGFSQPDLAWVVNSYLIAFGGLLLLAGRLGDLIGRRRMFLAGTAVFTAASLLCGLAGTGELLIAARFLQGAGGAMAAAVILGMVVAMFPEPRERATAIGVYSFVAAAGATLGLLLGGVLTESLSWHWIFIVNLPIGIATILFALRLLPDEPGLGLRAGADVVGTTAVTGALMLGVYTIVSAADSGWVSVHTLGLGAVSVALLAAFVVRQATAQKPLLPLRILRSRNVSGANAAQAIMIAGMFGMFFTGTLFLQRVLGYSSIEIGFAFLPVSVGIATFSLGFSARLGARFGPRAVLIAGLTALAIGLVLLTRAPADADYVTDLLASMVLLGVGAGLAFPSVATLAMADATPADSGVASGLVNTTQQVGAALGLAVLATLSTGRTDALRADGATESAALVGGYHLAFGVAAGFVVVSALVSLVVLRAPAPVTTQAEPELVPDAA